MCNWNPPIIVIVLVLLYASILHTLNVHVQSLSLCTCRYKPSCILSVRGLRPRLFHWPCLPTAAPTPSSISALLVPMF